MKKINLSVELCGVKESTEKGLAVAYLWLKGPCKMEINGQMMVIMRLFRVWRRTSTKSMLDCGVMRYPMRVQLRLPCSSEWDFGGPDVNLSGIETL